MRISEASWSTLPRPGVRVLVAGGAGGLGQAIIVALTALGAQVVGMDRPGAASGMLEADIRDDADVERAVADAAELMGGIDALVAAAAVVDTIHRAKSFPIDAFRRDVDVNLTGQFLLARAVHPFLCRSDCASIVLMSSIASQDGLPGQVAYSASKAGVLGLMRSLAAEWISDNIRVNAVVPGIFGTPKVLEMPESARNRMLRSVPMARMATLDEVVGPLLYLLSPAAGYTTGQALRVDGGTGLGLAGLYR